jgi:hypothetical protein
MLGIGSIDRIDFVPIMKPIAEALEEGELLSEPSEDIKFHQAFIYVRPKTDWATFVTTSINETGSYRFYPYARLDQNMPVNVNANEYWIILKNSKPIPYSNTTLNVHQLAHNNSLMETKMAEMEDKMLKMEEEIAKLKDENETLSCKITSDIERERDRCQAITEEEAERFVNSYDTILRMIDEQYYFNSESNANEVDTNEVDANEVDANEVDANEVDAREEEEDLVYDDSDEMTPRGRVVVNTGKERYYKYDMYECILGKDGYNNGDMAPRGELICVESDDEDKIEIIDIGTCSECGLKRKLFAFGWRHADDNLCLDCVNLPGMAAYEC